MSKNKTLNKVMKRGAKALDKARNPIDKIARTGVRTTSVAQRVVSGGIEQARIGVDSVLDISTERMRHVQHEKKVQDIVEGQLDRVSSDVRKLVDCGVDTVTIVTDGVVDVLDEVSTGYTDYRDENKARKAEKKARKTQKKVAQAEKTAEKAAANSPKKAAPKAAPKAA